MIGLDVFLREHIRHSQALRQRKNLRGNAVHGQERNTRAVHKIQDVQSKIQEYVKKYQQAHLAMVALGRNPQDPRYPELKDQDLYTKNVNEPHNLGDGARLRVGSGGKVIMETCLMQKRLNTPWILNAHFTAAKVQWHWAVQSLTADKKKLKFLHRSSGAQYRGSEKWSLSGMYLHKTVSIILTSRHMPTKLTEDPNGHEFHGDRPRKYTRELH
ncbi:hypothetical protein FB45DRAFT_875911 [Roridomyces roridus]|uniref:Uncharacterized protein n=1 Tax=Roridomyces roridus TaxID=1738132 RepID=A0AAD7B4X1_9AGAR|nr:hypothetical protein FB45DRAFT_875911 [Roridomyces roridus]